MIKLASIGGVTVMALFWSHLSLAQLGCGDIQFSSAVTSQYPNVRNACLGVVMRENEPYAHFQARIVRVRGGEVEAEFKQPDGTYGRPVAFTMPADARVRIQGRTYRYSELTEGQELNVYLPGDRWQIAVHEDQQADFATAAPVTVAALADPAPAAAALPRTASTLPWLALVGTLLLGFGALVLGARTGHARRS